MGQYHSSLVVSLRPAIEFVEIQHVTVSAYLSEFEFCRYAIGPLHYTTVHIPGLWNHPNVYYEDL